MKNVCRYAKAILKYIFGDWLTLFKGLVHSETKISLCFTPLKALGGYDFLLSDEYNQFY